MAREIVLLDLQPNLTLRVAFLFPIASVTPLTRTPDPQSISVAVANQGLIPALPVQIAANVPAPLTAVTYDPFGSALKPTSPTALDPLCAAVLSNLELAAYAAGMLVVTVNIVQLDAMLDTPATFTAKTAPGYIQIQAMYTQQKNDLATKYATRSKYIGVRLDAN